MHLPSRHARGAATLIALVAWIGLAVQLGAVLDANGSVTATLWRLLLYFTITTNLLVALLFSAMAIGGAASDLPRSLAGVTLSILLVGVIYGLLLRGLVPLSGGALLADLLLHSATPILVPLFWLGFARKGALRSWDPLIWGIYPLGYLVYALIRGGVDGHYAYPFINGPLIGWRQVGVNIVLIGIGFLAAGYCLIWLDRWLSRRAGR